MTRAARIALRLAIGAAELSIAVAMLAALLDEIVLHPPVDRRAFDISLARMWAELDDIVAASTGT